MSSFFTQDVEACLGVWTSHLSRQIEQDVSEFALWQLDERRARVEVRASR